MYLYLEIQYAHVTQIFLLHLPTTRCRNGNYVERFNKSKIVTTWYAQVGKKNSFTNEIENKEPKTLLYTATSFYTLHIGLLFQF